MTAWTTAETDVVVWSASEGDGSTADELKVGYAVDLNLWGAPPSIQNVHSNEFWGLTDYTFGDAFNGGGVYLMKSRGASFGAHGIVQDGDHLGDINFGGDDGASYNNLSAAIVVTVDGTPSAGNVPGRMSFQVAPSGGASGAFAPVEALGINSDKTSDFSGTVNITTPAGTSQGANLFQAGISSSFVNNVLYSGFAYNQIVVANDQLTGATGPDFTSALLVQQNSYGSDGGTKAALTVQQNHPVASNQSVYGDYISGNFVIQSDAPFGGTNTGAGAKGTLFAGAFTASANAGSTNLAVVSGAEVDVGIAAGASSQYRFGWSLVSAGAVQGASFDAALEIGSSSGTLHWKFGILLAEFHGGAPIDTAGTVIGTDGAAHTVANFADFHTYTFTGDILYFPNFRVTGAGDLSANSLLTATVTVANLPAASSGNKGMRMMVSNATATTFWSIVAGGGANIVPVTSDGTNWRIG